jgi:hypothetical protein
VEFGDPGRFLRGKKSWALDWHWMFGAANRSGWEHELGRLKVELLEARALFSGAAILGYEPRTNCGSTFWSRRGRRSMSDPTLNPSAEIPIPWKA